MLYSGIGSESTFGSKWVYDKDRATVYYVESDEERSKRLKQEEQRMQDYKERIRRDTVQLRSKNEREKKAREKRAREKLDRDKRATNLEGQIAHYRARVVTDRDDEDSLARLSMAKAQLFWTKNAL